MIQPQAPATLEHLSYLDGWRGLAIVLLLIGHFFPVPGIDFGTVGVNLFFVLSGYLMGQLLFIKETPIPTFYRRRISRIVPAHLFFVLCVVLFFRATARPIEWPTTLAALFFYNNYVPGTLGENVMPLGHIWSLSVEEHSYILLSLVALFVRRAGVDARWAVAFFTLAFAATGFWYWSRYSGSELTFDKWFHTEVSAYGIFASTLFLLLFAGRRIPKLPWLAVPSLLGIGLMLHWWSVPAPVRTTFGVGLLALTVNLLPSAPAAIKQVLSFAPLRWIGLCSFSIYLWQQPFYLATYRGAFPSYVAVSLAIACGVASFFLLERPARAYLNRVWLPSAGGQLRPAAETKSA